MHMISLTPNRSNERDDYDVRTETVDIVVDHIVALLTIHEKPEHPRGRGKFLYTTIIPTSGHPLHVTETPQQIRGIIAGN